MVDPRPANPWVLWQPVRGADPYTCSRCGATQTGERYLELGGTEPRVWPVLPRNPAQIQVMTSRVGRQVLCPACRWAQPAPPAQPKRRKTTLD
ncbi:MAG: hypothetical protein K6V97_03960 [Actinomycetia bacterium]|nr:hypothetical protein [Actinomycetes bacterium]